MVIPEAKETEQTEGEIREGIRETIREKINKEAKEVIRRMVTVVGAMVKGPLTAALPIVALPIVARQVVGFLIEDMGGIKKMVKTVANAHLARAMTTAAIMMVAMVTEINQAKQMALVVVMAIKATAAGMKMEEKMGEKMEAMVLHLRPRMTPLRPCQLSNRIRPRALLQTNLQLNP